MKLITFVVPCYNSQAYMSKCIDSLLAGGEDVEIIIVNDGSKDGTGEIARVYAEKYPELVRAVDKENGGHGSGINCGLMLASGLYFKVVDSDDWLSAEALKKLLAVLKTHESAGVGADLYITDFVYEKACEQKRFVRSFKKNMPVDRLFGWNDVKKFRASSVLLMHSLLYRTEKLRQSGVRLPEHTFYVDNIFAYTPLPFMKTLYYMDIDLYHYYIGREDQSVTRENITKRYRQQIAVMKEMISAYGYAQIKAFPKGLCRYMLHCLSVVMILTLMFTTSGRDERDEREAQLNELWRRIKQVDKKTYKYLYYRSYPALINWLSFAVQGKITYIGYCFFKRKLNCS